MERPLVTLEEWADPRHAAVIVVDMQKDFLLERLGGLDPTHTDAMMPRLLRLLEAARKHGVQIIHVRVEHPTWTNSAAWLGRKWKDDGPTREFCVPGTEGAEFMDGFEPRPGEIVVTKNRYSAFINTNLDLILRSLGIKTIIATGTATNNCVEATARDGHMLDYNLIFMSDGTASYDAALHESTLVNIRNHYGKVVSVDELIGCWEHIAATSAARAKAPVAAPAAR
jgi:ureidoacrylate peracid hydrolase